ncbi:MAG: sugar transporter [Sulfurovum sp.]|nr:MAG: sugar transporter [Sulfurovum sp.]
MSKTKLVMLAGILLILNGCTGSNDEYQLLQTKKNTTDENTKVTAGSIEYLILPQDRLAVSLYKDPAESPEIATSGELGQSMNRNGILVNAAGVITMPLIGKIKVGGLTQSQAAEHITKKYKKYLNTPSVYVEVMNKRLIVVGEVKKPGVIPIPNEKMNLFEAIAAAGDLTDSAVRDSVTIISNNPVRGIQMRTVDLTNFDTMIYASLMLRPNDIVYVKPSSWKAFRVASADYTSPFVTLGEILRPFVQLNYLINNND